MIDRAVICLSGGMDSAVTGSMAARGCRECFALHVDYGQRTSRKEQECFHRLADHLRAAGRYVANIGYLSHFGGSSLTDLGWPVEPADLERRGIPSSYVPFRNAHLLAIAVSWAEVLKAGAVYIGAVGDDSSGYPDCRPEFYQAFQRLADLGTRPETSIRIITPVLHLRKDQIVAAGLELGTPFDATWSCYQSETEACGECDSCALRLRGFQKAGVPDPIPYKKR